MRKSKKKLRWNLVGSKFLCLRTFQQWMLSSNYYIWLINVGGCFECQGKNHKKTKQSLILYLKCQEKFKTITIKSSPLINPVRYFSLDLPPFISYPMLEYLASFTILCYCIVLCSCSCTLKTGPQTIVPFQKNWSNIFCSKDENLKRSYLGYIYWRWKIDMQGLFYLF